MLKLSLHTAHHMLPAFTILITGFEPFRAGGPAGLGDFDHGLAIFQVGKGHFCDCCSAAAGWPFNYNLRVGDDLLDLHFMADAVSVPMRSQQPHCPLG